MIYIQEMMPSFFRAKELSVLEMSVKIGFASSQILLISELFELHLLAFFIFIAWD